jgi:hypothetical protein
VLDPNTDRPALELWVGTADLLHHLIRALPSPDAN